MSYHSSIYYDNYTYTNLSNNVYNSELTNINLYTKSIVGYKLGYLDTIPQMLKCYNLLYFIIIHYIIFLIR